MYAQRGTDDDFYAEYPASAEEALAAEQLDRRLPWAWVKRCTEVPPTSWRYPHLLEVPPPPGSTPTSWKCPQPSRPDRLGRTDAWPPLRRSARTRRRGTPTATSRRRACWTLESWGQVAELTGKIEPSTFATYLDELGRWYNGADVMAERNNHGHLLIRELQRLGNLRVLAGYDGRPGWLSTVKGKPLLYGLMADAVREGACVIRGSETAAQLASIEASTLRAPVGLHDDRADAFALAHRGGGVETRHSARAR